MKSRFNVIELLVFCSLMCMLLMMLASGVELPDPGL